MLICPVKQAITALLWRFSLHRASRSNYPKHSDEILQNTPIHTGQFPQIYLYDDHLEVMSHGDPLRRMTREEFLRGKSKPLNAKLMKIAINIELTDRTGKGNKDIVKAYGPEAFEFSDS
ncbi:MAG: hypothetical protein II721_07955, partial [Bacilli bacterium]|nr:hypothetical protein [Bacilli bacterium]